MDFSWARCTGKTCCNVSDGHSNEIIEGAAAQPPGVLTLEAAAVKILPFEADKEENICSNATVASPLAIIVPAATAASKAEAKAAERSAPGKADKEAPAAKGKDEPSTMTYKDGSSFTGQLVNGKRQGTGNWKSLSTQYDGQWDDDLISGHGHQTWQDGRKYHGEFQKGKFHGHGRMEWHTPQGMMIYEGSYVDDAKHGRGKFVWSDGRVYDGEWRSGKRWGKGVYINARGDHREGIWTDDKLEKWLAPGKDKTASPGGLS
eukprot:TRINITY_DN113679_c0_g1_i1.p2 TRINITY_DN113679_c0_g1~~TRINITY_DN113679_c0_g1_i1.p2  ORF type:complete len:261 (-),score=66.77 TRINITY_DN113679_c0_g1_i1:255-1037(-)